MPTLIHLVEDHAQDKAVPIFALSLLFATELAPTGWQILRGNKGNNSWRIYLAQDGKPIKIWYFTGYDKGVVVARNEYFWKQVTKKFIIKTRVDAIRFVEFAKKT